MILSDVKYLLEQTNWAAKRSIEVIKKSFNNSICYGVFLTSSKKQIGFARVITDYETNYYLCDVVIDKKYRGNGIGKELLSVVVKTKELNGLLGMLITEDAEEFYKPFGFKESEICLMMTDKASYR